MSDKKSRVERRAAERKAEREKEATSKALHKAKNADYACKKKQNLDQKLKSIGLGKKNV